MPCKIYVALNLCIFFINRSILFDKLLHFCSCRDSIIYIIYSLRHQKNFLWCRNFSRHYVYKCVDNWAICWDKEEFVGAYLDWFNSKKWLLCEEESIVPDWMFNAVGRTILDYYCLDIASFIVDISPSRDNRFLDYDHLYANQLSFQ